MTRVTPKRLWILSGGLFILQLGVALLIESQQQYCFPPPPFAAFLVSMFTACVLTIVPGLTLGALTALIPFRKKTYIEKFKVTTPMSFAATMLFWIAIGGYRLSSHFA